MENSCGNKSLVHAIAVTGLGGTGKTQLALRYVEQHKQKYDTILWIDTHDEKTIKSSFARCCNALLIEA
jgi:KaiC/GvpD/RAD55 family RecA-like ATPase